MDEIPMVIKFYNCSQQTDFSKLNNENVNCCYHTSSIIVNYCTDIANLYWLQQLKGKNSINELRVRMFEIKLIFKINNRNLYKKTL